MSAKSESIWLEICRAINYYKSVRENRQQFLKKKGLIDRPESDVPTIKAAFETLRIIEDIVF